MHASEKQKESRAVYTHSQPHHHVTLLTRFLTRYGIRLHTWMQHGSSLYTTVVLNVQWATLVSSYPLTPLKPKLMIADADRAAAMRTAAAPRSAAPQYT